MTVDWAAVATVTAPIIALVFAAWLDGRRTRLIAFYSHVNGIRGTFPGAAQPVHVNTHTVVLRNTGRNAATNVRLHHAENLPLFSIWPQVAHHVDTLPDGSQDIVVPMLIPGEQIAISYLYFPPLTYNQINQGIKCDQGFAQSIPVILQRQRPRWFNRTARLVLLAGVGSIAYFVYRMARCVLLACATQ